jgi:hypothetical protein
MILTAILASLLMASPMPSPPALNAADIVVKMAERDRERRQSLRGYTAARRYVLENAQHRKQAEMLVRVDANEQGMKTFSMTSSAGWGAARKHVFPKLLSEETDASKPELQKLSQIAPENYMFTLAGTEVIDSRDTYVIVLAPKVPSKYLIRGRIWIDAGDYALVRVEGEPAKSPSFWIKSIHFVHQYAKDGPYWFPAYDRSVSDARFFGSTEVRIEYFNYEPNGASLAQREPDSREPADQKGLQ